MQQHIDALSMELEKKKHEQKKWKSMMRTAIARIQCSRNYILYKDPLHPTQRDEAECSLVETLDRAIDELVKDIIAVLLEKEQKQALLEGELKQMKENTDITKQALHTLNTSTSSLFKSLNSSNGNASSDGDHFMQKMVENFQHLQQLVTSVSSLQNSLQNVNVERDIAPSAVPSKQQINNKRKVKPEPIEEQPVKSIRSRRRIKQEYEDTNTTPHRYHTTRQKKCTDHWMMVP